MLNSQELKKEMIEWLSDCEWGDIEDNSQFEEMSYIQLRKGVEKHYEGGFQEFMLNLGV